MHELITAFKEHVKEISNDPQFVHHEWFVKYHLEIVERIAFELCDRYPEIDRGFIELLVWLHDYGKIVDFEHQYEATLTEGKKKLLEIGFATDFVEKAISYIQTLDKKEGLENAPLEIQIVSSADGASHLIGPFYTIHWKERHDLTTEALIKTNKEKALIDWEKKIVLSEVKEAFHKRHEFFLEQRGDFSEKFLKN